MARRSGAWKPKPTPKKKKPKKWEGEGLDLSGANCGHSINYVRDNVRMCSWCNRPIDVEEAPTGGASASGW